MPIRTPRWLSVAIAYGLVAHGCSDSDDGQDVHGAKDASVDTSAGKGGSAGSSAGTGGKGGSGGISDASGDVRADAESGVGCVGDDADNTPPTITSAALISANEVRITFSEPVRPPVGVDPTKFRLSVAYSYNAEGPIYTYYEDLVRAIDSQVPFSTLQGTCTAEISALTTQGITLGSLCDRLNQFTDGFNQKVGLYLHFRQAGTPTLEDRSGNLLADVAESWATPVDGSLLETRSVAGDFVDNPIRVSVACPNDAGTD